MFKNNINVSAEQNLDRNEGKLELKLIRPYN